MQFIIIKSKNDINKLLEWLRDQNSTKQNISGHFKIYINSGEKKLDCAITLEDLFLIKHLIHNNNILWTPQIIHNSLNNKHCIANYKNTSLNSITEALNKHEENTLFKLISSSLPLADEQWINIIDQFAINQIKNERKELLIFFKMLEHRTSYKLDINKFLDKYNKLPLLKDPKKIFLPNFYSEDVLENYYRLSPDNIIQYNLIKKFNNANFPEKRIKDLMKIYGDSLEFSNSLFYNIIKIQMLNYKNWTQQEINPLNVARPFIELALEREFIKKLENYNKNIESNNRILTTLENDNIVLITPKFTKNNLTQLTPFELKEYIGFYKYYPYIKYTKFYTAINGRNALNKLADAHMNMNINNNNNNTLKKISAPTQLQNKLTNIQISIRDRPTININYNQTKYIKAVNGFSTLEEINTKAYAPSYPNIPNDDSQMKLYLLQTIKIIIDNLL